MKKGVYNMPNIYANGYKNNNIYFTMPKNQKVDPKKQISKKIADICVKKLAKDIDDFAITISNAIMQER